MTIRSEDTVGLRYMVHEVQAAVDFYPVGLFQPAGT